LKVYSAIITLKGALLQLRQPGLRGGTISLRVGLVVLPLPKAVLRFRIALRRVKIVDLPLREARRRVRKGFRRVRGAFPRGKGGFRSFGMAILPRRRASPPRKNALPLRPPGIRTQAPSHATSHQRAHNLIFFQGSKLDSWDSELVRLKTCLYEPVAAAASVSAYILYRFITSFVRRTVGRMTSTTPFLYARLATIRYMGHLFRGE